MGTRGPVGKRPDRRHGHGARADAVFDEVPSGAALEWPEPGGEWHDIARRWYLALRVSGPVVDYQQSDVEHAYALADNLARHLSEPFPVPAAAMSAFQSGANDLLATVASRRRVRMEIERNPGEHERAHVAAVESLADRRKGPAGPA